MNDKNTTYQKLQYAAELIFMRDLYLKWMY